MERIPKTPDALPPRRVLSRVARHGAAAIIAGLTAIEGSAESIPQKTQAVETRTAKHEQEKEGTVFDKNPDFLRTVTVNGDFTPEERRKRKVTLENGAEAFQDVGLLFYRVQKGDTLSTIRATLARLPRFSYLREQTAKIESFNIPSRELQAGMWLPIPMENEDRYITEEQFVGYAKDVLEDLRSNSRYGPFLREILKTTTEQDLLAMMVAVAKQEAGGRPLGRFELHRWEPRHNVFSFSLFHVLMKDAGLDARRGLNKSEGQLYHPQNAAQLFIAFLKEKGIAPTEIFPLPSHVVDFARLYNGRSWRRTNPHYVRNILNYYNDAREMLKSVDQPPVGTDQAVITELSPEVEKEKPKGLTKEKSGALTQWEKIGNRNLTRVLRDANALYRRQTGKQVFSNENELYPAAKLITSYLRRRYNTQTYYPHERLGLGIDALGVYVKFERDGSTALIRIRRTGR